MLDIKLHPLVKARRSQAEAEALEKCEAEALEQRRSRSRNSFPKKPVVEQDELECLGGRTGRRRAKRAPVSRAAAPCAACEACAVLGRHSFVTREREEGPRQTESL